MARIRTVKPEFFTSVDIVERSPLARLLYIALWCEADKEGRLVWSPKTFKLRYLPADNCDIDSLCNELVEPGLVVLYGKGYAFIPAFKSHQHINPRESESQLPNPDASPTRGARVSTRQPRDSDAQGGREGKGKEGDARDASTSFEVFWAAYPLRRSKADALKAWVKLNPSEQLQASILKAIAQQSQGEDWLKEGGRFIPHASTWLNGKRWDDEVFPGGSSTIHDIFAGAK